MKKGSQSNRQENNQTPQLQAKRVPAWEATRRIVASVNRRCALVKGNPKEHYKRLKEELFLQRLKISRQIKEPDLERLKRAIMRGDWQLIGRAKKLLKKKSRSPLKPLTALERFLVKNWPDLCECSDAELRDKADAWFKALGQHAGVLSSDALEYIKKVRLRLGLTKPQKSR